MVWCCSVHRTVANPRLCSMWTCHCIIYNYFHHSWSIHYRGPFIELNLMFWARTIEGRTLSDASISLSSLVPRLILAPGFQGVNPNSFDAVIAFNQLCKAIALSFIITFVLSSNLPQWGSIFMGRIFIIGSIVWDPPS